MKYILSSLCLVLSLSLSAADLKKIDLKEWSKLDSDEQGRILGEDIYSYDSFEELELDEESLPAEYRDIYLKAKKNAESSIDSLEFDDTHARVGEGTVSYVTIYKLEGELVGMNVGYFFKGCDMSDESSPYFENEKEAEGAGCEFSDVSWSWAGSFNIQGELIYDPGYPEWSGY